jgi:Fe-Mn family superoxide dismutase
MKHEMPKLPYAPDSLAPYMSRETLEYHYGKHLQTYVDNLNKLIDGTKFADAPLETIVKNADGPIFNNGAQVWNHTFFFAQFSPRGRKKAEGRLAAALDRDFGSFDTFREEFTAAALGLFGSGWVWLCADRNGKLSITKESNAGNPLAHGFTPLMTCDVWEHAYYIDCRNRRADYLKNFWEILDWTVVEKRMK